MKQEELFSKNDFEISKLSSRVVDSNNFNKDAHASDDFYWMSRLEKNNLNSIKSLIKTGQTSEAESLIYSAFSGVSNPMGKYCQILVNEYRGKINYDDPTNPHAEYHGSDIKPYLILEAKFNAGFASEDERKQLLSFWHSYPLEKTHAFRVEIFKFIASSGNHSDINPELIFSLIEFEQRPKYKSFFVYYSWIKGYIDSFEYRSQRLKISSPDIINAGKDLYHIFEKNKFLDLSDL